MPQGHGRGGPKQQEKALRMLKPGLTNTKKADVKAYAKQYSTDMIDILVGIAHDEENFPRDRIAAAEMVLNRAHGKPGTIVEDEAINTIDVQKLSTAQLTEMLNQIKAEEQQLLEAQQQNKIHDDLANKINLYIEAGSTNELQIEQQELLQEQDEQDQTNES